jgi:hypothetical protein
MCGSGQSAPRPPPFQRQSVHCHPRSRNSCRAASRHIPGFGRKPTQTLVLLVLARRQAWDWLRGGLTWRESGDPQFGGMRSKPSLYTRCPPAKGTLGSQALPVTETCPGLAASRSGCMHKVGGRFQIPPLWQPFPDQAAPASCPPTDCPARKGGHPLPDLSTSAGSWAGGGGRWVVGSHL